MLYFPNLFLENIDEKKNLRQIFSNVILTSSKDGIHIELVLKQKDKNALQLFLEAIIENKTLENYL
jgi:F0F1-type ATP synthase delta subunit